jgi:hypothetical protein
MSTRKENMTRKIIMQEKINTFMHPQDDRILIEENGLKVTKTIGFNYINEKQNFGEVGFYIDPFYTISHNQMYIENEKSIDCHADSSYDLEDYSKRKEDFDKLMHVRLKTDLKDIPDETVFGPFSRDKDGVKLIGDVSMSRRAEGSFERFRNLFKHSQLQDFLIEINYK